MAIESVTQRMDAIDDPMANRALIAILTAIQSDLAALKTSLNTHTHPSSPAVATVGTMGTLNTTT